MVWWMVPGEYVGSAVLTLFLFFLSLPCFFISHCLCRVYLSNLQCGKWLPSFQDNPGRNERMNEIRLFHLLHGNLISKSHYDI
jgi:hypothetical protein